MQTPTIDPYLFKSAPFPNSLPASEADIYPVISSQSGWGWSKFSISNI